MKKALLITLLLLIGFSSFAQKKSELIEEVGKLKSELTEVRSSNNLLLSENNQLKEQLKKHSAAEKSSKQTIDSLTAEVNRLNSSIVSLYTQAQQTESNVNNDSVINDEAKYLSEQIYIIKGIQEHLSRTITEIENKVTIAPPTPQYTLCISGKSFQPLFSEYLTIELTLDKEKGIFHGNIHGRLSREIGKIEEQDHPVTGQYILENGTQVLKFERIDYESVNICLKLERKRAEILSESSDNEPLHGSFPTFKVPQGEFNYSLCD